MVECTSASSATGGGASDVSEDDTSDKATQATRALEQQRRTEMELHMEAETAVAALCGGAVLGVATVVKLSVNGNILGISGIVNGISVVVAKPGKADPWFWRLSFLVGFLVAGAVLRVAAPTTLQPFPASMTVARVACAGALVGFGSSVGSGCTSGHGISGLTRFSPRSFVATMTFMGAGFLTASLSGSSDFFGPQLPPPVKLPWSIVYSLVLVVVALGFVPVVANLTTLPDDATGASPDRPARLATEFVAATIFGLGLGIAGMGRPQEVISFLDVGDGDWDPSLALVMGAALGITVPVYHLKLKKDSFKPVLNSKLDLPAKTKIDVQLVVGSALFGIGWGLCGVCPGPALIGIFAPPIAGDEFWPLNRSGAFVGSMLAGTLLHKLVDLRVLAKKPASSHAPEPAGPIQGEPKAEP